jgi:hypothetical protein
MNEYNDKGEKDGYWEEDYSHLTHKGYYVNGKEHGIWTSVNVRPLYIRWAGSFYMGNEVGYWSYFNEDGKGTLNQFLL